MSTTSTITNNISDDIGTIGTIRIMQTICFPGHSIQLIPGTLSDVCLDKVVLIKPINDCATPNRLAIAHSLSSVSTSSVTMQVLNTGPEPITLYKEGSCMHHYCHGMKL